MLCNEVMSLLKQNKLNQNNLSTEVVETKNPLVIGLYYDDPESVPEDELRYAVGAVLSRGKINSIGARIGYIVMSHIPSDLHLDIIIQICRQGICRCPGA